MSHGHPLITMPKCHATSSPTTTYGTWYPDRPKGYVRHGQGILPSDSEMAQVYRSRATHDTVFLNTEHQQAIITRLVEAVTCINCRLHAVATDKSHVHVLVSWRGERTWQQNREPQEINDHSP